MDEGEEDKYEGKIGEEDKWKGRIGKEQRKARPSALAMKNMNQEKQIL